MNKPGTMLVILSVLALSGCGTEVTAPAPAASRDGTAGPGAGGKSSPVAQPAGPRYEESPTMIGSGN